MPLKVKIYQIDTFTDRIFSGNPAAVCPLDKWLPDDLLQQIAMENNLAETAFYVKQGDQYEIRWFTPTVEVDLCGHATLASAYVLCHLEGLTASEVRFYSPRSGDLPVKKRADLYTLNFPADDPEPVELFSELTSGFNRKPVEAFKGKTDYLLVFKDEQEIRDLSPKLDVIANLQARGVIVTAQGKEVDFVSRFFAPQSGINEDPVTGSAHTTLTPYWFKKIGKQDLTARQLSNRQGYLKCNYLNERVEISGQARLFMQGTLFLD